MPLTLRSLPLLLCLSSATFLAAQPAASSPAQPATSLSALAPGLTLPIVLGTTIHAGKTRVGTPITARTSQRVLLPGNLYLKRGAELSGTVVASSSHPSTLVLRFTTLRSSGYTVPLVARTLALASFFLVSDTFAMASGSPDRGNNNPANWTTRQIGGDEVVRTQWSGPVIDTTTRTVGFADFDGIYADPLPPSTTPRALGPFSSSSHGLAGYNSDCALLPAPPGGTTAIQCATSALTVQRSDVLLLEVLP